MQVEAGRILIYGANGYSGALAARMATEYGWQVVLAGRNRDKVEALAAELGQAARVFALDDRNDTHAALRAAAQDGVNTVLHCAGPFFHTAERMADACIANGLHYLDITGEIPVFELVRRFSGDANKRGVMLLPGAGFDVVPSDCLASYLARRQAGARRLSLAFVSSGRVSHGTATTMLQNIGNGGMVRRDGKLERVPAAYRSRAIDYGRGKGAEESLTIPWGDVSTAFYSTAIPNIEVYTAMPFWPRVFVRSTRVFGSLFARRSLQKIAQAWLDERLTGPTEEQRARGACWLWGEVEDDAGRKTTARLRTPEGYTLTAQTSLECARRAAAGEAPSGFQTPALAFGPDFILQFDGVERHDVADAT